MRVSELKRENFRLKIKQRLIIVGLSCFLWFFYIQSNIKEMKQKRIDEIESIDISNWENKMGYD